MIKRPLILVALSYILGCLIRYYSVSKVGSLIMFLVLFGFGIGILIRKEGLSAFVTLDAFLIALPLVFVLGQVRMDMQLEPEYLDQYKDRSYQMKVIGTIEKKEQTRSTNSYIINHVILYPSLDKNISIKKKIIVYSDATLKVGNKVSFYGKVNKILPPTNEGQFNSKSYYQSKNITYQMFAKSYTVLDNTYSPYYEGLESVRKRFASVYTQVLPEKNAGIIKAMLLGEKNELNKDVKTLFQQSGIAHILAISGLHISFIGLCMYKIFRRSGCSLLLSTIMVGFLIYSYGTMTGFSVSTNRAIVMLMVSLTGVALGRTYDMMSAISLSAFLILLQSPVQLFQTGFILSFLAVITMGSVIAAMKGVTKESEGKESIRIRLYNMIILKVKIQIHKYKLESKSHKNSEIIMQFIKGVEQTVYRIQMKNKEYFCNALDISILLTTATIPVIAYSYFEIPLYSILINIVILPLCSFIIILGLLIGILGISFEGVVRVLSVPLNLILSLYRSLCSLSLKLPFHLLLISRPTLISIICYYILYGIVVFFLFKKKKKRYVVILMFLWIVLLKKPDNTFTITMLDISQGDCNIIHTPDNKNIVIDGGSIDVKNVGEYRIIPYLKANGISTLDYVFITHMDADHISGIKEIIEKMPKKDKKLGGYDGVIRIQTLILANTNFTDDVYNEMVALAKEKGITVRYMGRGDKLKMKDVTIKCLHPYHTYKTLSRNDASIVLEISYKDFSAVFTGDLEAEGENEILQSNLLSEKRYDVLKVAHHGSKGSTQDKWLKRVQPKIALISSGYDNPYGHPNVETLDRLNQYGVQYYKTIDQGQIRIRIWENRIELYEYK